jgi:hypothetical protein
VCCTYFCCEKIFYTHWDIAAGPIIKPKLLFWDLCNRIRYTKLDKYLLERTSVVQIETTGINLVLCDT